MMDSEEEEEQTALVCDNGKFRDSNIGCIGKMCHSCRLYDIAIISPILVSGMLFGISLTNTYSADLRYQNLSEIVLQPL